MTTVQWNICIRILNSHMEESINLNLTSPIGMAVEAGHVWDKGDPEVPTGLFSSTTSSDESGSGSDMEIYTKGK